MKPDSRKYNPDPGYLRGLIECAGLTQVGTAKEIGISGRTIRRYLSGEHTIPYSVQFAVECLVNGEKK